MFKLFVGNDHFRLLLANLFFGTSSFASVPEKQPQINCFVVYFTHWLGLHWIVIGPLHLLHGNLPLENSHWLLTLPIGFYTLDLLDWSHHHLINGCTTSLTILYWASSSLAYLSYCLNLETLVIYKKASIHVSDPKNLISQVPLTTRLGHQQQQC